MAGKGPKIGERAYARPPSRADALTGRTAGGAHTVPLAVSLRERAGAEGSGILSLFVK
jgi:hypothetical protein